MPKEFCHPANSSLNVNSDLQPLSVKKSFETVSLFPICVEVSDQICALLTSGMTNRQCGLAQSDSHKNAPEHFETHTGSAIGTATSNPPSNASVNSFQSSPTSEDPVSKTPPSTPRLGMNSVEFSAKSKIPSQAPLRKKRVMQHRKTRRLNPDNQSPLFLDQYAGQ